MCLRWACRTPRALFLSGAKYLGEGVTMRGMDILAYNRAAWDHEVASGDRWTVPVGAEEVARARGGDCCGYC